MKPIRKAFTVVELLVVLAIIALLVGLVVVSMSRVQKAAARTATVNALRSMTMAYTAYSTDHRGKLMPGFVEQTQLETWETAGTPLKSRFEVTDFTVAGSCNGTLCDQSSYVWRLAPYMNFEWQETSIDYKSKGFDSLIAKELEDGVFGLGSAVWPNSLGLGGVPSIGLNSIYLGGDNYHGGADITDKNPWDPVVLKKDVIAATQYTHARNPSKLIVFAPTQHRKTELVADEDTFAGARFRDIAYGYCELRPPFVMSNGTAWVQHWYIDAEHEVTLADPLLFTLSNGGGVPIGRWGASRIPVGHLDGSTAVEDIGNLGAPLATSDKKVAEAFMSRWSPFVVAAPVSPDS